MIPISKPYIGPEEMDAVMEVMKSGMIAQGPKVRQFEESIANYCRAKHAIAVNSGTAALHASLYAAGIGPGDEVITVPFTFAATANSVIMQNAKPIFCDIEEKTFNIDPGQVEKHITKKTKAILPVDLYGQAYDVDAIREIAAKHSLKIIEDACQAIGAEYRGRRAGTFGDIGAFSFYATKNIATAEGGMIVTDNAEYAEQARRFRHHGQSEQTRYEYFDLGYNYRMTDIQAAIGIEQLKRLEDWVKKRIGNARFLTEKLSKIEGIIPPAVKPQCRHVFHQYTIRIKGFKLSRDEVTSSLKQKGIGTGVYYPKPLHMHPFYAKMGYKEGMFPVSEKASREVVSLPVHASLSQDDLSAIAAAFEEM